MRHLAFRRLAEDAVSHCVPEKTAQIQHANGEVVVGGFDFCSEVFVGYGTDSRNIFSNLELPHGLEG